MADTSTYGFSGRWSVASRAYVPSAGLLGANRFGDALHHRGPRQWFQATYSYSDVLEVKVIKSLLTSGVALNRARQAVECLRNSLGGDLASAVSC